MITCWNLLINWEDTWKINKIRKIRGKSTDHEALILGYCPFTQDKTFIYVNIFKTLEDKTTEYFLHGPYNITVWTSYVCRKQYKCWFNTTTRVFQTCEQINTFLAVSVRPERTIFYKIIRMRRFRRTQHLARALDPFNNIIRISEM